MTDKTRKTPTEATLLAARAFTRRTFVKGAAATGAIAVASPAYIKKAMSSSGEVDILMWSDYLPDTWREAFTKETGIKINFTGIGSNEEILQ